MKSDRDGKYVHTNFMNSKFNDVHSPAPEGTHKSQSHPEKKYIFWEASLYALLSHTPLRYDGGAAEHTVISEVTLFHRDDDAAQQLHNHTHTYSTTWTKTVKISVCALASQIVRILMYI